MTDKETARKQGKVREKEGERGRKKTGRIITSQTKSWKTTARFKVGALTAEMAVQKERKKKKRVLKS